jgi:demethylmenaquinone methyltransferase/2-methoxy-6-polyprenyl-1,4-benzoquinol methylase
MEAYYARRAAEYEKIYDKPERQTDLARLRSEIPAMFTGERVLEIACGTGYWTPLIAAQAESVMAVCRLLVVAYPAQPHGRFP